MKRWATTAAGLMLMAVTGMGNAEEAGKERPSFWIDLALAEPVAFGEMMEDLKGVDVVFLGETHRLARHHRLQLQIVEALAESGRPLILGLEQIEARNQGEVDRFNAGELDFDGLAGAIEWEKQWRDYENYRGVVEAVRAAGGRVAGLNGPREVIRAVGKGGVDGLGGKERAQLPEEIFLDDPLYEKLMGKLLMVHMSVDESTLRRVFEAQAARDESMAAALVKMSGGSGDAGADTEERPLAVVICGAGHCQYGLGTPDRVAKRMPGVRQRIVLMSESGDLELTEEEKAMSRDLEFAHGDFEFIDRPVADFLHAVAPKREEE